jgi:hypothetical protein
VGVLDDLVAEATGRRVRTDPVRPGGGGPAGNARLTAWTGALLLALVVAQLVTLLDVDGWISWHVTVGALLVPVALTKTATTSWRFLRYYRHSAPYRVAGPPPAVLRVLGPLVVVSTLAALTSGIVVELVGPDRAHRTLLTAVGQRVDLVTVHQVLAIGFLVLAGLHLLGRVARAFEVLTGREARTTGSAGPVPGGGRRALVLVGALAAGAVVTALLLPGAADWHRDQGPGQVPDGISGRPR